MSRGHDPVIAAAIDTGITIGTGIGVLIILSAMVILNFGWLRRFFRDMRTKSSWGTEPLPDDEVMNFLFLLDKQGMTYLGLGIWTNEPVSEEAVLRARQSGLTYVEEWGEIAPRWTIKLTRKGRRMITRWKQENKGLVLGVGL